MILSRVQLEEIAAAVTDDFNQFFFGIPPEEERDSILPTLIDQLAEKKKPFLFWKPCQSGKEGGERYPSSPGTAVADSPRHDLIHL